MIQTTARYWHLLNDAAANTVQCELCPHTCTIADGRSGICMVRTNRSGILYADTYARVASIALDPIEKKPLYHFRPGTEILSLGTIGCNFKCSFCQNWTLSQGTDTPLQYLPPEQVIALCRKHAVHAIAFTYNEPSIWLEYIIDTGKRARENGIALVLVSNGFLNEQPLTDALPYIDAVNIDVKSFTNTFYRRECRGTLDPVLRSVEQIVQSNTHIELTQLIIPGVNDSLNIINEFIDWVAALSTDIPVHFSRFHPQYKMSEKSITPESTLMTIFNTARKKLRYVYLGNMHTNQGTTTRCPHCGAVLIIRNGYRTDIQNLTHDGKCSQCHALIPIVLS